MARKKRRTRARRIPASRKVKEDKDTSAAPSTDPHTLRLPDELLIKIFSLGIDFNPATPERTPHDRKHHSCRYNVTMMDDSLVQSGRQIGLEVKSFLVCKRFYNIAEEVIRGSTTRLLSVHLIYGKYYLDDFVYVLLRGSLSRHRLILDYIKKLYLEFVTGDRNWMDTIDHSSSAVGMLATLLALKEIHVRIAKRGPEMAARTTAPRQSLLDASANMGLQYSRNVKVYFRGQAGFEDLDGIIKYEQWEWYDE